MQLQAREPEYAADLIENVVSKAAGVFLWVHIVVKSLLAGMSHGDHVSDLQRRLDLLPADLEHLYDKILSSLDPFYLEHAAQLFKIVEFSKRPLAYRPLELLPLYYADEEDIKVALSALIRPLSPNEAQIRRQAMRNRLNSRCKGLLEVCSGGQGDIVQYLHRTVKDFIEGPKAHGMLHGVLKAHFDPSLRLCAGYLSRLKSAEDFFQSLAERTLVFAEMARPEFDQDVVALLDELDRTAGCLVKSNIEEWTKRVFENRYFQNYGNRVASLLRNDKWVFVWDGLDHKDFFGYTFLSLTIRFGITAFVRAKADLGCLEWTPFGQRWPLLADTLEGKGVEPNPGVIVCMLEKGADPNAKVSVVHLYDRESQSVWSYMVYNMFRFYADNGDNLSPAWSKVATAMLRHGATSQFAFVKEAASDRQFLDERGYYIGEFQPLENPRLKPFYHDLLNCCEKRNKFRWHVHGRPRNWPLMARCHGFTRICVAAYTKFR